MYNNIIRFLTVTAVFFLMGCGSAQTYLTGQLERQAGGFSEPGGPDTEPSGAETVTDMETGGMDTEAETPVVYYVHISGAVAHPGVYALPEGSRLYEAVQEAGGFTRTAAEAYCNLAAKLQDGMQYYIPTLEEAEQMPETAGSGASGQGSVYTADGKLDLNLAGKEDLLKLNGIGESKAEAILAYRDERGGFQSVEELKKVSGIGDGIYAKLQEAVTVSR